MSRLQSLKLFREVICVINMCLPLSLFSATIPKITIILNPPLSVFFCPHNKQCASVCIIYEELTGVNSPHGDVVNSILDKM